MQVQSLGQEDPLEKEMVTHSNILAWRIPWTEEPARLQSMESQRVRHNWSNFARMHALNIHFTFTSKVHYWKEVRPTNLKQQDAPGHWTLSICVRELPWKALVPPRWGVVGAFMKQGDLSHFKWDESLTNHGNCMNYFTFFTLSLLFIYVL